MRRKLLAGFLAFVILVALGTSLWISLRSLQQAGPRFMKSKFPSSASLVTYDFLNSRPFESGKMWCAADRHVLIYDFEKRQVLGTLTNGWPVLVFGDPPQVLCYQPSPKGLKQSLLSLVAQVSGGRIKVPPSVTGESYWLLDTGLNDARLLGNVPGTPNALLPSPNCHFAITTRMGQRGSEVYLLDLQRGFVRKLHTASLGWVIDWWDNSRLLLRTTNMDFVLYDIATKAVSPIISFQNVAALLRENGVNADAKQAQAFVIWNGRENEFYLTDTHQKWLAQESFLVKVERPDAKLKLLSPRFKFEWSDHFDPSGRWYLYSGRESGDSSDGVFVRDLVTGTNRVLVAATTNRYFSIPRFYKDSVVYIRSNALWQISLDGANNVRLFPGVGTGQPAGHP